MNKQFTDTIAQLYGHYFHNIDLSKFKPGVKIEEILQMMTLIADGYVHELQRTGKPVAIGDFMEKYRRWSYLFKRMAYQEAYIDD